MDKLGREGESESREREEKRKETNSVLAQSHAKADLGNLPQDVNTGDVGHTYQVSFDQGNMAQQN